jgi:tellurite resistance protein
MVALWLATGLRIARHPEAWREDLAHPVRHVFLATLPIALLLVVTAGVARLGPTPWLNALWWLASLGLLPVTLWVLSRWWRGNVAGGLVWASVTPALFIPIVGNVLVPLAGVPLGHPDWSALQFGAGLLFWPVVLVLLVVRLAVQGALPERLLPASFILIAPPAVVGLSAGQFGAPGVLVWMLFGMAALTAAWVGLQGARIARLPFSLNHWGLSFPLTALVSLALALAQPGQALANVAPVLLALASVVIGILTLATVHGLQQGTLLTPEPVATLSVVPASTA